jgi:hypothetical protein
MRRSIPFYNRKPWNWWLGTAFFLAPVVLAAALTSWWLLSLPLAWAAGVQAWNAARRVFSLARFGYHAARIRGGMLRYEERTGGARRSFVLRLECTEPGRRELFVPDEKVWAANVPDWAAGRRPEIAGRIARTWRRRDVRIA